MRYLAVWPKLSLGQLGFASGSSTFASEKKNLDTPETVVPSSWVKNTSTGLSLATMSVLERGRPISSYQPRQTVVA